MRPPCRVVPPDPVACVDDRGLAADYAYLLGVYLGDGFLSAAPRNVWKLRISLDARYPGIIERVESAILEVSDHRAGAARKPTWVEIYSNWRHWICLFPQHGRGEKHLRPILLDAWQEHLVKRYPREFITGMIHSDGCRALNRVMGGGSAERPKRYEYPRYFFSNRSADLRELFQWACALIGVESRPSDRWNISVAKRESVAILDSFVGPKR